MAKLVQYAADARMTLLAGVGKLTRAVRATLGPRGRTVLLERKFGGPLVTKDGVTVAKEIDLPDPYENIGAQLVREVAEKTSDLAGDGTTTATVLAYAILREGMKNVTAGADPMALKRGIDRATQTVVEAVKKLSAKVHGSDELAQVGTISANGDATIGKLLAEAMEKVGKAGVVTVEDSASAKTELEVVEGMRFDRGYLSPYFVTDAERMEVVLKDALVLLYESKLSNARELLPLLENVSRSGRPLLIVAEEIEGEALATLVVNKIRGTFVSCAVKAPGYGERRKEMMQDLAVLTGGTYFSTELGKKLEDLVVTDLGSCDRVTIDREDTTIVGGRGKRKDIEARIEQIKAAIKKTDSDYDREKLQERLAKLAGGVAVVRVGAATEIEMKEKKARVEDALHATRAAAEEGVVPGGGVALVRALKALDLLKLTGDEATGARIIRRAIQEPLRAIAQNAGLDGSSVLGKVLVKDGAFGFNAETLVFEDLVKAGVIDPTKVVRVALENAASIASLLLSTECSVVEKPKEKKQSSKGASHAHAH